MKYSKKGIIEGTQHLIQEIHVTFMLISVFCLLVFSQ